MLAELGLRPQDCLAFEDSEYGLRSCLRVGIPTLVIVINYTAGQNFTDALVVIDHRNSL